MNWFRARCVGAVRGATACDLTTYYKHTTGYQASNPEWFGAIWRTGRVVLRVCLKARWSTRISCQRLDAAYARIAVLIRQARFVEASGEMQALPNYKVFCCSPGSEL